MMVEKFEVTAARMENRYGINFEGLFEFIYGLLFLLCKFKIGVIVEGDNYIDVLMNDIGIVVVMCDGKYVGYNVYVGGGMGCLYCNDVMFLWVVIFFGFCGLCDILYVVKVIMCM